MQKSAAILFSFLLTVIVMAQNDAFENINTEVQETITNQQYDFAPPLAVNAEDQDVPLQPIIKEDVTIDVNTEENNSND